MRRDNDTHKEGSLSLTEVLVVSSLNSLIPHPWTEKQSCIKGSPELLEDENSSTGPEKICDLIPIISLFVIN